jgi:hypothetical protein
MSSRNLSFVAVAAVLLVVLSGPTAQAQVALYHYPFFPIFSVRKPDLTVKDLEMDVLPLGELSLRAKIKNRGNAAAVGTIRLAVCITQYGHVRYYFTEATLNLAAGSSTWVSFPPIDDIGVPYELTAHVWVDVPTSTSPFLSAGNILELDETNNHRIEALRNSRPYAYEEVWAR